MEKSATNRKKIWKILILGENITHLTLEREKHGRKLDNLATTVNLTHCWVALSQTVVSHCRYSLRCIVAICHVALPQFVASHCRKLLCRIVAICHVALSQFVVSHCSNLLHCIVAICCVAMSQFVALHCRKLLWCRIVALSQFVALHCRNLLRCIVAIRCVTLSHHDVSCWCVALLHYILYIHYYANTVRYVRLSDVAMQDIWDRAGGPVFTQGPVRFRK